MAKKSKEIIDQIVNKYKEKISALMIERYGGSYQNLQTMGETWTEKISYNKERADLIFTHTNVFFKMLDIKYRNNLNLMNDVCKDISEFLAPYMGKASTDNVTDEVLNNTAKKIFEKIFLKSPCFVPIFLKNHKKIDTTNYGFVNSNPGVMAMWYAQQQKS